jgi:hypothetical protein
MSRIEIALRNDNGVIRVEYIQDTTLYVIIKHSFDELLLYPSWHTDQFVVSSSNEAVGEAIKMIEVELTTKNQPKPLTATEAFEQAYNKERDSDTHIPEWGKHYNKTMNVAMNAMELYVTSQIEHLKKELQK